MDASVTVPDIPGVDTPADGHVVYSPLIGRKVLAAFAQIRCTFDTPKGVERFREPAVFAEAMRDAILEEWALDGPVSVTSAFALDVALKQTMWADVIARLLCESADDAKVVTTLVNVASGLSGAGAKTLLAAREAHLLECQRRAKEQRRAPADPRAAFRKARESSGG